MSGGWIHHSKTFYLDTPLGCFMDRVSDGCRTLSGICVIVADVSLFVVNMGNTWTRELRAPLVDSLRQLGPTDPKDVNNSLVDYPFIWNWLLTVNLMAIALDTLLIISSVLDKATLVKIYLTLSFVNNVHTVSLVLPTITINYLQSKISDNIFQQQERLSEGETDPERRRAFDGLVLDWKLSHLFALISIVVMVLSNIYIGFVTNIYRKHLQDVSVSPGIPERREDVRTIEINEIIAKEANGRPLYNKNEPVGRLEPIPGRLELHLQDSPRRY